MTKKTETVSSNTAVGFSAGDAVSYAPMRTPADYRAGTFVEIKMGGRGALAVVNDNETGRPMTTRPSLVRAA